MDHFLSCIDSLTIPLQDNTLEQATSGLGVTTRNLCCSLAVAGASCLEMPSPCWPIFLALFRSFEFSLYFHVLAELLSCSDMFFFPSHYYVFAYFHASVTNMSYLPFVDLHVPLISMPYLPFCACN